MYRVVRRLASNAALFTLGAIEVIVLWAVPRLRKPARKSRNK
jgi:hypothetical protein